MPIFDPDAPISKRHLQSREYRRGVIDTLGAVYEKAHQTEDLSDFQYWVSLWLAHTDFDEEE